MKDAKLFPIEVDLSRSAFQYESVNQQFQVSRNKKKYFLNIKILNVVFKTCKKIDSLLQTKIIFFLFSKAKHLIGLFKCKNQLKI
jgi:hypothetical protein